MNTYDDQAAALGGAAYSFDDIVLALGRPGGLPDGPVFESAPTLSALREAGTSHVYFDGADVEEMQAVLACGERGLVAEIDGNTANQPLVKRVVDRILDTGDPSAWAKEIRERRPQLSRPELRALLYAILCGRIGNETLRRVAGGRRSWETSLQLHMAVVGRPELAREVGHLLRRMVPSALVKVPFAPHAPDCFLVARDLEREGTPVNFTSTFSARQVVAAALLTGAARTNVFMGRLSQGLSADLLGEHVVLESQRALRSVRRKDGVETQLIVASVRDWRSVARTAGCDVYTLPADVVRGLLAQTELAPGEIQCRLGSSYAEELGIDPRVEERLGRARIARLWRVEDELLEFLRRYRASEEYAQLRDGDQLARRFDEAGFGDFFHAPDDAGWDEIRRDKLPDLDGALVSRIALDTHYSLRADADFERHQAEIDARIDERAAS